MKEAILVSGAAGVAGISTAVAPEVPWWGHLLMNLVAVALAFFGGRAQAAREKP
jgi:hypothetical protein